MLKSRGRKIFRDVWARKGRTAMASIAIFVGVLGVVILVSVGDLMVSQLEKDLQADELAMQQIFVTLPAGIKVDNAAALETLRALPGVTNVEGRAFSPILWKQAGDEGFEDGYVLAASEPFEEIVVQPMRLSRGSLPVAGQKEVAIEKRMATEHGLEVGDELVFRILGGDGGEETWTIVGVVYQPYASFIGENWAPNEASVFAAYDDAQSIAGFAGFSALYVRYIDFPTAEVQARTLAATLAQETPYVPVADFKEDPAANTFISITQQITGVLTMLAAVAMIVSGFLVFSIINTIVVEQKQQIGVMKSLGATRWDNILMYSGVALIYGILGTIPAVLLGVPIGFNMAAALAELPNSLIDEFTISSQGVTVGIVMGLLVPLLAAAIPVFLGTRVSILDAMTDLGISSDYGRGLLARAIRALPLPVNARQALSNVTRKKGRLFLTWLTLMLAVAAFMGVFSVFSSLNEQIASIFDTFGYDLVVSPNEGQNFDQVRALILEGVEEVEDVYPGGGLMVEVEGYFDPQRETSSMWASGYDPGTGTFDFDYEQGTGWQDDPTREGVVLSSGLAETLGKGLGDKVILLVGGQDAEFEVIGVVSFPSEALFLDWKVLAELAGFMDLEGEPVASVLPAKLKNADPSVDQVEQVIDQISDVLLAEGIVARLSNQVQNAEDSANEVMTFGMVFGMTAAVMAAVGAIGLLAALSMAVFERQKEIGVMRSIGASSATVASQFLIEGVLVGILAWIIAVPLAYLFSEALVAMLPFGGISDIPFAPSSLLVGLIGIVVVATISSLWPSISAARKTVAEILRYQ
jgi:putative ABC transport system permease protein